MSNQATETRLPDTDPARIVRTGPRRRGRWTYVVDRYNGDRWRLDGTILDLEFDPLCNGDVLRGSWVLHVGDQYIDPISHFLDGYCCAMDWIERVVDGENQWTDFLGRPEVPDWLTQARVAIGQVA